MNDNNFKRIELYCMLIDIVKKMKLNVFTQKEIKKLNIIENNLNKLMGEEYLF